MMRMVSTDNDRDRGLEAFFVHAEATKEKISKIHSVISVIMHVFCDEALTVDSLLCNVSTRNWELFTHYDRE